MTKVYTKRLTGVPKEHAEELYHKYKVFNKLFARVEGITIPKVLGYSIGSIEFEYVDLSGVVSNFYIPGSVSKDALTIMGKRSAQMHKVLQVEGSDYIHGDLWPLNIVVNGSDVVIFDLEPPKSCNNFYYYHGGDRHIDIAIFVFWTFFESYNNGGYIKSVHYRYALARAFMQGYSTVLNINKLQLIWRIVLEFKRFVCIFIRNKS